MAPPTSHPSQFGPTYFGPVQPPLQDFQQSLTSIVEAGVVNGLNTMNVKVDAVTSRLSSLEKTVQKLDQRVKGTEDISRRALKQSEELSNQKGEVIKGVQHLLQKHAAQVDQPPPSQPSATSPLEGLPGPTGPSASSPDQPPVGSFAVRTPGARKTVAEDLCSDDGDTIRRYTVSADGAVTLPLQSGKDLAVKLVSIEQDRTVTASGARSRVTFTPLETFGSHGHVYQAQVRFLQGPRASTVSFPVQGSQSLFEAAFLLGNGKVRSEPDPPADKRQRRENRDSAKTSAPPNAPSTATPASQPTDPPPPAPLTGMGSGQGSLTPALLNSALQQFQDFMQVVTTRAQAPLYPVMPTFLPPAPPPRSHPYGRTHYSDHTSNNFQYPHYQ